ASRLCSVFFILIRRPPRSTLFPTRRSSDLERRWDGSLQLCRNAFPRGSVTGSGGDRSARRAKKGAVGDEHIPGLPPHRTRIAPRSEEHTSELQSRENLVCRLLLEKKKKKKE